MSPIQFRSPTLPAMALAAALVLAACDDGRSAPVAPPTIIFLVADGWRADRASETALGFLKEPALSFTRAYAPSSLGTQSMAAIFSGRMPTRGGSVGLIEAQPAPDAVTLATRLRKAGYSSAFVSQASWAARPGFTRGFDDVQVAPETGWDNEGVLQRAVRSVGDWQASAPERPFFLVAHWQAPELSDPTLQLPDVTAEYDRQIAASTKAMGELLSELDERQLLLNAIVIVTSGHGFELLEHGGIGSGWTVNEEVVRVPLFVLDRSAGASLVLEEFLSREGLTSSRPISTLHLTTMLLELADAPTDDVLAPPSPVLTELVIRERAILRAVIDDDIRYLRVLREVPLKDRPVVARGYEEIQAAMLSGAIATPPLFGEQIREELMQLESNGGFGVNELPLAEHIAELSRLRAVLREYQRRCELDGWLPPEITDRMPIDLSDVKDLEILGYL